MSLKELTHYNHTQAETHRFTKLLLSGQMPKEVYYDYLFNQLEAYKKLEQLCELHGLLHNMPGIYRTAGIYKDLAELTESLAVSLTAQVYPATTKYLNHLDSLDGSGLLAHVYVRHMGDLYGGQMIKKIIPGNGHMYEFVNRSDIIKTLREKLDNSLAPEANRCFELIFELFDELAHEHNIQ